MHRHLQRALKFPMTLLAAFAVIGIGGGVYHYTINSPYFEVDTITIGAAERISQGQLTEFLHYQCGISPGVSLLQVHEKEIAQALRHFPEIKQVAIRKEWPNALNISITEREAVGIFVSSTGSYVFDESGILFSRASAKDHRELEIPPLTGLPAEHLEIGLQIPEAKLALANRYHAVWSKASPELFAQLSELYLDETGVTLTLENGERFFCGMKAPEATGPVIESLLMSQADGRMIAHANLTAEEHITMTRASRRVYHLIPSLIAQGQ